METTNNQVTVNVNGNDIVVNTWKGIKPFTYQAHNDKIEWAGDGRRLRYKSETVTDESTIVMVDGIPVATATTEYVFQPELSIGHPDCEVMPVIWAAPDGQNYLAFQWFNILKDSKGKTKGIAYDGKIEIPGRISVKLLESAGMQSDDANAIGAILAKNGCQLILTGNSVYQKKKESDSDEDEMTEARKRTRNLLQARPAVSVS